MRGQSKTISKVNKIIPYILMIFSFFFSMSFIKHNYYKLMNSDTSAEIMLGKHLFENGGLFSKSWYYSTEIKILDVQILYKLFYSLFSDNWMLIRLFTSGTMLILVVISYLFMMHSLELYNLGLYTAWILLLPFSQVYGYMIIYGVYYDRVLILTFLSIGINLKLLSNESSKNKIILIFFVLINVLSGMYGMRQAMIFYAPLILTALFEVYTQLKRSDSISLKDIPANTVWLIKVIISATILYGIGYLINLIISKSLQFHGQSFVWDKFSLSKLLDSATLFVDSFGQYESISVLRPYGIASIICIISIILMAISVISFCKNSNKLSVKLRIYTEFVIFSFAITSFLASFCYTAAPITYWIPIIPLFIPFWGMILKYDDNMLNRTIGKYACIFVAAHIALSSLCTFLQPNDTRIPYCKDYSVYKNAAQFLQESDYTEGFAPFWLADMMTEMTTGKLEMWSVIITDGFANDPQGSIYEWLQVKSHKESLPNEKFIVLTHNPEYANANNMIGADNFIELASQDENLIYSDEYARIYAFNSIEELLSLYNKIISE